MVGQWSLKCISVTEESLGVRMNKAEVPDKHSIIHVELPQLGVDIMTQLLSLLTLANLVAWLWEHNIQQRMESTSRHEFSE